MAHQIVDSQIAYQNQVPWHGLGTKMDPNQSTEEWLKAAKLDWEVKTIPLIGRDEETGEEIKAQNRAMFVRSSDKKILTYASESWTPLQNRDAVDFMQRYVSAGDAQIETVGALRDGQIIWCLANLNHQFEVRPGDLTNGYLLITSPHVAGQAIRVQTTTVRVVCANTMAAANRSAELHYRQSHRAEFNVDLAAAAVASAHDELSKMEKRCKILDKLKINAQDAIEKVILPIFDEGVQEVEGIDVMSPDSLPRRTSAILESILNGPGAIPDTGWGVLNGVTHYLDHVHGRSQESRFRSAQTGWGMKKKLETEARLLELAS